MPNEQEPKQKDYATWIGPSLLQEFAQWMLDTWQGWWGFRHVKLVVLRPGRRHREGETHINRACSMIQITWSQPCGEFDYAQKMHTLIQDETEGFLQLMEGNGQTEAFVAWRRPRSLLRGNGDYYQEDKRKRCCLIVGKLQQAEMLLSDFRKLAAQINFCESGKSICMGSSCAKESVTAPNQYLPATNITNQYNLKCQTKRAHRKTSAKIGKAKGKIDRNWVKPTKLQQASCSDLQHRQSKQRG